MCCDFVSQDSISICLGEKCLYFVLQRIQNNIEKWEQERRKLIIEEQEAIKIDKTFFEQANLLLDFCKDCYNAFLKGNAEQKRKIVKIAYSNFSYCKVIQGLIICNT